jgi:hypothetical protein
MQEHLNIDDLLRFHEGSTGGVEAMTIGRHLAGCGRCAALAEEMFADAAPRGVASALRSEPAPRARRVALFAAAAIAVLAVAAALLAVFAYRRAPERSVAPPSASYGRAEWDALVRNALARGTIAVAAPAAATTSDVLRGPATGAAAAMSPSATAVESAQPEFSWPSVPKAHFVVTVVAGDDVAARSGTLDRNRWTAAAALARGRTYTWQVRVLRAGSAATLPAPPQPNPGFRVLSESEWRDLAAARAGHPRDHLLLGVLAAHYGLRAEARRELAAYAAEHPSPAASRLAASVR